MEDSTSEPIRQGFNLPASRKGSIRNNESEIFLLKRRIRELEARIVALEP